MAFYIGSTVQDPTPSLTVANQIKATITSHSNWSFVETVAGIGAGANSQDVYKCSGAGNVAGTDFYLAIIRNTAGTGGMTVAVAEGYNMATHHPQRPAMIASASTITTQADCGIVAANAECDWNTGTLNPGVSLSVASIPFTHNVGATSDYFIVVGNSSIIVGGDPSRFNSSSTYSRPVIAGLYDSLIPNPSVNDPMPLAVVGMDVNSIPSNIYYGAATRQPMAPNSSIIYGGSLLGNGNNDPYYANLHTSWNFTTVGSTATVDQTDLYVGAGYADKIAVVNSYTVGSASSGRDKNGWIRGTLRHVRYSALASTLAMFDVCTMEGVDYFYSGWDNTFIEKNPA